MGKLEQLRISALESCKFRGHNMTRFASLHSWAKVADCKTCGMSVFVNSKPALNGIDISGKAVALHCTGHKKKPVCTPIDFLSPGDRVRIENYQASKAQ